MIDAWILTDGTVIDCTFPRTHLSEATKLFPKSDNPELVCERLNYVKMCSKTCGQSGPAMYVNNPEILTQAQMNKIDDIWKIHYSI